MRLRRRSAARGAKVPADLSGRAIEELDRGAWRRARRFTRVFLRDVTKDEDLETLGATMREQGRLDIVVHSIAFAKSRGPQQAVLLKTSREGYIASLREVSAYSLVAVCRRAGSVDDRGAERGDGRCPYYGAAASKVIPNYNVMGVAKGRARGFACGTLRADLGPSEDPCERNFPPGPIKNRVGRGESPVFSKILESFAEHAPLRRQTDPAGKLAGYGRFFFGAVIWDEASPATSYM